MASPGIDTDTLAEAIDDFMRAMELRRRANLRVAKRVTAILRIGMLSVAVFAALLAGMIWTFTDRTRVMTGVLGTMYTEFAGMAENMVQMRGTLGRIDQDMAAFTSVSGDMNRMRATISAIEDEVDVMAAEVGAMRHQVGQMAGHTIHMDQSFRLLAPAVSAIGATVARGSEPVKTFNRFFPFPRTLP